MKYRKLLFAALASAISFATSTAWSEQLTVGTFTDIKPFDFVESDKIVGFDQDLWGEIAKELKKDYKLAPMDFGALIPALQTANIDVGISSIFITPQRKAAVDFSDPYYVSTNGILVSAKNDTIKSAADMDGKKLASLTGSSGADWIKNNAPNAQVTLFPTIANAYLELQSGRVDAVVYDFPSLAYYAKTDAGGSARLLEEPVGDKFPLGIAFPKGSDLVKPVNEVLSKMKADGRYAAIEKKWFGTVTSKASN